MLLWGYNIWPFLLSLNLSKFSSYTGLASGGRWVGIVSSSMRYMGEKHFHSLGISNCLKNHRHLEFIDISNSSQAVQKALAHYVPK